MTDAAEVTLDSRAIGFVGTYLPRRCGIATFTFDLAEATAGALGSHKPVYIVAMNENVEGYPYPSKVKIQIHQENVSHYHRAARFLNDHCDVVSLQHEFGIFGGEGGSHVMQLIENLRVPLVVTCHTVYGEPEPVKRNVLRKIVASAHKLVVMDRQGIEFLQSIYGARREQIVYIRHGIHDIPFEDPPQEKKVFGVSGPVILTFGLLHRNKGIEYMIDAMAEIVRSRPDVTYVVAGQTHPAVVRQEGESYRRSLEARVEELGLESRVKFIDRFVELSDLKTYLSQSDMFAAPYLFLDQMTSGALSYAVGAGNAVIATPFHHAKELLAEGRGYVVPVADSRALSRAVLDLLENKSKMNQMRQRAYEHTRGMVWPVVARQYVRLFRRAIRGVGVPVVLRRGVSTRPASRPAVPVRLRRRGAPPRGA
jgi:glycosyltransferase involved in cell wall biosynthesis